MQMGKTLLISLGVAAYVCAAVAQDYPTRPIKMVVPFPAGGPTDAIGRVIAAGMAHALKQPLVIENIGGAAGSLGTGQVARAVPDGYTIGLGNAVTHVANGALYPLSYDIVADFAPVSPLVSDTPVIVGRKSLPTTDLRELIAWLRANPDKALAGTAGRGSQSHEVALYFEHAIGARFQLVPYRGLGPATQDLIAGQIDFMMSLPAIAVPQVRAGTIKAYAVTAKTRLVASPDIPTVDEAGLPGFYNTNWHALFAPKGTAAAIVARLNAAVRESLADPEIRNRLIDLGQQIYPPEELTPTALAELQKADIATRWPLIKAAGTQ